jgi:signal transduction histidine kinase
VLARGEEESLRKHQRMDAFSKLAGGIAHEINNPIQGIVNYAELIGSMSSDPQIRDFSAEIVKETMRVANLVKATLEFAQADAGQPSNIRLPVVLSNVFSLTRNLLFREDIQLAAQIDADLPTVSFQLQQLQQVLVNLLSNSRDALVDRYPKGHPDKRILVAARAIQSGGKTWVQVEVSDPVSGIQDPREGDSTTQFSPAEYPWVRSNLGWAISQGIVANHGGRLYVQRDAESSARTLLELPASLVGGTKVTPA